MIVKEMKEVFNKDNWTRGVLYMGNNEEICYEVKHFETGSQYGIDNGRISKLFMIIEADPPFLYYDKDIVIYDRAWYLRPDESNEMVMSAYNTLIEKYN